MKNLKDYIGKNYNIICDNKEEWDAIVEKAIKLNYLIGGEKNTYIKEGYSPDKYLGLNYKGNLTVGYLPGPSNRTVIKASEFISLYFKGGTYIVALIDNALGITGFNTGCIGVIKDNGLALDFETIDYFCSKMSEKNGLIKSFKTKEEAEAFAETLKPKTMTLLDEAKAKYPIGTKYKCPINDEIYTIKSMNWREDSPFDRIFAEGGCGSVYHDGKWVEIIETPKEVDEWIGKTVRITQNSIEKGKTGKVLSITPDLAVRYYIEGLLHPYTEKQFEEVIETPKVDKSKAVVHCKTQEEWDFVFEKLGCKNKANEWKVYKETSFINLQTRGYGTITCKYEGYYIYTFEEWCKEFGHSMKVEYIEITKQSNRPDFYPEIEQIGKILKVHKDDFSNYEVFVSTGTLHIQKDRVKSSTKEAYEKQKADKYMEAYGGKPNSKTLKELAGLEPTFKKGDKVLIVKDFSTGDGSNSAIQGTIGTFVEYNTRDNAKEYPYVAECAAHGSIEKYCVHKIEHFKAKKSLDLSKPFCILLTVVNRVRIKKILGTYFNNKYNYAFSTPNKYYGVNNKGIVERSERTTDFNDNVVTIEELEQAYSKLGTQPTIPQQIIGRTPIPLPITRELQESNIFSPTKLGIINSDRAAAFGLALQASKFTDKTTIITTPRGFGKTGALKDFIGSYRKEIEKATKFRLTKPTKTFKDTTIIFPTQINIKLKTKNKL